MRVDSLKYFLAIANLGSFSRASSHLYVSQQGLSKSIRALEREFGVSLFERTGKRVHLTEAGLALVPLAKEYVDIDERLRAAMREQAGRYVHRKAAVVWAMPFITTALFTFMKDELDVRGLRDVILEEKDLPAICDALSQHDHPAVCALIVVPRDGAASLKERGGIRFKALFEARLGVIASESLVSPRKRLLTIGELSRLPIASYIEPVLDNLVATLFGGVEPDNVVIRSTNLAMIYELVDGGKAVTFWDSFSWFADKDPKSRVFVEVEGAPSFEVGFAYATDKDLPTETINYMRGFESCIKESCARYLERYGAPRACRRADTDLRERSRAAL